MGAPGDPRPGAGETRPAAGEAWPGAGETRPGAGETRPGAGEARAVAAVAAYAIPYAVVRHGRVASLEEAAAARGVRPEDIIKTLVVRRADDDYLFVLVPGGRQFSWPKLRALLGTSRLSMPDAAVAKAVTGYERGTITPFGSTHPWPVIADEAVLGRTISLGAGAHGVSLTVNGDDVVRVLDAQVADIADGEDGNVWAVNR